MQRAGVRPLSSGQDRHAGATAANRRPPYNSSNGSSAPRPASAGATPGATTTARTEPAAACSGGRGGGAARIIPHGATQLHPRLRPGPAKQPANRVRPPDVPLGAALNLSLVEHPDLYGMPPPGPPPPVPRLQLAAVGLTGLGNSASALAHGSVFARGPDLDDDGPGSGEEGLEGGGSFHSINTLPSLAATLGATQALAAASGSGGGGAAHGGGGSGGGSDVALRGGGSVVSFKLPLPPTAMPMTPTVRGSPHQAGSLAPALQRQGGNRTGGGVTFTSPSEQDLESNGARAGPDPGQDLDPPHMQQQQYYQQPQPQQHQVAWRPSAAAGGSGDLSSRIPPPRKSSAGLSYASLPYPSYNQPQAHQPAMMQWHPHGRSLSGETTTAYGSGSSSVQGAPAAASGGATPRERYKGILERLGRAAAHMHRDGRRPGAMAAAAGSAGVRRRSATGVSRAVLVLLVLVVVWVLMCSHSGWCWCGCQCWCCCCRRG